MNTDQPSTSKAKPIIRRRTKQYGEPLRTRTAEAHWDHTITNRGTKRKYYGADHYPKRRRTTQDTDHQNVKFAENAHNIQSLFDAKNDASGGLDFSIPSVQSSTKKVI